jgi:hypothetical protein
MTTGRERFRLSIPLSSDIFLLVLGETKKRRILDISENGVRFLSDKKHPKGSKAQISLSFPWLDEIIPLGVKIVRVSELAQESVKAIPSPGGAKWETSANFEGLPLNTQELVFQQVRVLDWQRRQATPDGLIKPRITPATSEDMAYEQ